MIWAKCQTSRWHWSEFAQSDHLTTFFRWSICHRREIIQPCNCLPTANRCRIYWLGLFYHPSWKQVSVYCRWHRLDAPHNTPDHCCLAVQTCHCCYTVCLKGFDFTLKTCSEFHFISYVLCFVYMAYIRVDGQSISGFKTRIITGLLVKKLTFLYIIALVSCVSFQVSSETGQWTCESFIMEGLTFAPVLVRTRVSDQMWFKSHHPRDCG